MDNDYDIEYFLWLMDKVGVRHFLDPEEDSTIESYLRVALMTLPFQVIVPQDENRRSDGERLRRDFVFERGRGSLGWFEHTEVSFLEVVVGLAERMAMQSDHTMDATFWHMMRNAGFPMHPKERTDNRIVDTAERINERTYAPDGSGGFFPLVEPDADQRKVELLYQMYSYILESEGSEI